MLGNLIIWILFVVPWFSLFFMPKQSLRRFLPTVILTILIVFLVSEMAYVYGWWIQNSIVPWGRITNVFYAYGLFPVATFWVFHFTYGKFPLYMLLNIIMGGLWTFPFLHFLGWFNIFRYQNFNEYLLWSINIVIAIIIYGFQLWHENRFKLKV